MKNKFSTNEKTGHVILRSVIIKSSNWKPPLESGEVKQKLTDFKDSVTHVKFNHDGSYLAVADMSGLIIVLKVLPNLDKEPVWSFETGDMSWLDWHPGANVLFAGTADSSFWMWKIPSEYYWQHFYIVVLGMTYFFSIFYLDFLVILLFSFLFNFSSVFLFMFLLI